MPGVFSKILLVSLFILSGCANKQLHPSIDDHVPYKIAQVSSESNANTKLLRDYPYFIVCNGSNCPAVTKKTPIRYVAFNSKGKAVRTDSALNKLPAHLPQKGRSIDGKNTTYLHKESSLLEQYRVHFDYASALVSDAYQDLLESFVKDYPHEFKTIRITGFTDSGTKPNGRINNDWLALERATDVKKKLITLGYPESQILLEAKFLCCYIDSNENEEGRRNNRRAEISLLNFKSKGDSL